MNKLKLHGRWQYDGDGDRINWAERRRWQMAAWRVFHYARRRKDKELELFAAFFAAGCEWIKIA